MDSGTRSFLSRVKFAKTASLVRVLSTRGLPSTNAQVILAILSKFCGTLSKSSFETEVVNYMNQTVSPEDSIDTLKWWAGNKTSYHSLAKLARFISTPASAAAIDRVWSTGGLIATAKRFCLRPD